MTLITLKSIRSILHTMGLLSSAVQVSTQNPINWPNCLYTIPLLALLFPLGSYFYANIVDLVKATDAFYVIAATLMCLGQYWFLVMQKSELNRLLLRLQFLVEQSKCCINFTEEFMAFGINFSFSFTLSSRQERRVHHSRRIEMSKSKFPVSPTL